MYIQSPQDIAKDILDDCGSKTEAIAVCKMMISAYENDKKRQALIKNYKQAIHIIREFDNE